MATNNNIKKFNKTRNKLYRDSLCHAPFNAITFDPLGFVKNCCLSNYPIGKYPNDKIIDIINGETNNMVKSDLDEMHFPSNCKDCEIMLKMHSFNSAMINMYDNFDIVDNREISRIEFSLENTCNLQCIMCGSYRSSNHTKQNITKGYYGLDFLKEIEPYLLNIKSANFAGGEPFLIEIYYKIWDFLSKYNPTCNIYISTNGTILNDRIKDTLANGNFHITVSVDAINPNLYEKIRIGATYEAMQENLNYFIQYSKEKNHSLNFSICPMQINIEELPTIGKYTKENNLGFYLNTVIAPYDLALWTLDNNQFKKTIKHLKNNNPFKKKDQGYTLYLELIKRMKMWSNRDLILAKHNHLDRETFLNDFYETLIFKNINMEKVQLMKEAIVNFDEKFYTEQLIQQFQSKSDYQTDILNSFLNEKKSAEFIISTHIYYSIFKNG